MTKAWKQFMKKCPKCSAVLSEDKQKCDACGLSVSPEFASTIIKSNSETDSPTKILETGNQTNKTPSDGGRFVAGTVLAKRYRILGILGKGGMGEVYKADDLELGQTVALKFLPESFSKNEAALARFRGEVRTARQVSHPNVCRVFDIGEIEGVYYLSMEYVDGDDLSQLLRRIGYFASDKAVEISRQICYGLQAIHNAGILHRDLKPANIIIDSQGKTRITDFGIAGLEKDLQGAESRIGTPAYMSPEQIAGKEVTTQSDIYSLGLLLYEIFTGEQAINGGSVNEILKKQTSHTPPNVSKFVETIDPLVENIINRCLEKKPENRPKSALQVAASLPGGNPLEAAIAAGETPTPEMIAAVPKKGTLKPKLALVFSIFILAGFILSAVFQQYYKTYNFTPLEKSPEVLAERAKEIVKNLGYTENPVDAKYRLQTDGGFVRYVSQNDSITNPRERLRAGQPFAIYFVYRQSPDYLVPWKDWEVTENDPPLTTSGMTNVLLDTRGRLIEFVRVQSEAVKDSASENSTPDWTKLFSEAGLDITKFEETEPNWTPPVSADSQTAWKGTLADFADIPIRIETASLSGKPVYFKVVAPWDKTAKEAQDVGGTFGKFKRTNSLILYFALLVGAVLLVLPKIKVGSRDYKGGLKVAVVCFLGFSIAALIDGNHFASVEGETSVIYQIVSFGLYLAVLIGTTYIALEPSCPPLVVGVAHFVEQTSRRRFPRSDDRTGHFGRRFFRCRRFSFAKFSEASTRIRLRQRRANKQSVFSRTVEQLDGNGFEITRRLGVPGAFRSGLFVPFAGFIHRLPKQENKHCLIRSADLALVGGFRFSIKPMDRRNFLTRRRFDHNFRPRPFRTAGDNYYHFLFSFVQCLFNYF